MKKFNVYLIDLDGTLVDSKAGIFACIHHALKAIGKEENDEKLLNSFIGPPLYKSFGERLGITKNELDTALSAYVQKYESEGQFMCKLYPDVIPTLQKLKSCGSTLVLATSKWQHFAKQITDRLDLTKYFDLIQGGGANGHLCEKHDIIRQCFQKLSLNKTQTAMVGDRKYDMIGAKQHGITAIGVLYGYGDSEELNQNGADYLINNISELLI